MNMNLKVLLPTKVLLEEPATKVVAEAQNGSFGLLPRHVDFVTALVPGILTYTTPEEREVFMAVDEGVLIKRGQEVIVSTRNAVVSSDLGTLSEAVQNQFLTMDEHERSARSALARLESSFVRRFLDLGGS